MTKVQIILASVGVLIVSGLLYFFLSGNALENKIALPYIAHQRPVIDPHLPDTNPLSDKLDEVQFDGLFNISANASGIIYEDGLGELVGIDENNVVTIKLKTDKKWSSSYNLKFDDEEFEVSDTTAKYFSAEDLNFTLRRIQNLGSLSPDYILIAQALENVGFSGPNSNMEIKMQFKDDRIWSDDDIKEVLSFKILPANSEMNALNYQEGSGPYLQNMQKTGVPNFVKNPASSASLEQIILQPFIDNSTLSTELKNNNINVLLNSPFGSLSPILNDSEDFFYKPSGSTTFFALLFNTERLNLEQRKALRSLIDNKNILDRFFKVGTPQQREIVDFRGERNNFDEFLNYSIFPSSSYYVEEEIVIPNRDIRYADLSVLSDTVQIQACVNFGHKEEYLELIQILNDPKITNGKVKVTAVINEELLKGNYDAILIAFDGYKSNFLFDFYDIFLREPNLERKKINLITEAGKIKMNSLKPDRNFFRLDGTNNGEEGESVRTLLKYIYGFMSTKEIGDKQVYAERIAKIENELVLGSWLFSLPTVSYFSNQFDEKSISLYGVAAQLATIEKWKERIEN